MNFDSTAETNTEKVVKYYGSHNRKVDAKGRFHLPFQFRIEKVEGAEEELVQEEFMISPGPHGSWALMPLPVWEENFMVRAEGQSKGDFLANQRYMSQRSFQIGPDKQGRIAIPPMVKGPLGVEKEILIVGMGSYMELWAPESADDADSAMPSDDYLFEFFG